MHLQRLLLFSLPNILSVIMNISLLSMTQIHTQEILAKNHGSNDITVFSSLIAKSQDNQDPIAIYDLMKENRIGMKLNLFWFSLFEVYNTKKMWREAIEALKQGYIRTYNLKNNQYLKQVGHRVKKLKDNLLQDYKCLMIGRVRSVRMFEIIHSTSDQDWNSLNHETFKDILQEIDELEAMYKERQFEGKDENDIPTTPFKIDLNNKLYYLPSSTEKKCFRFGETGLLIEGVVNSENQVNIENISTVSECTKSLDHMVLSPFEQVDEQTCIKFPENNSIANKQILGDSETKVYNRRINADVVKDQHISAECFKKKNNIQTEHPYFSCLKHQKTENANKNVSKINRLKRII